MTGYFVSFEGPDGAGKSTVAKITARKLNIVYIAFLSPLYIIL